MKKFLAVLAVAVVGAVVFAENSSKDENAEEKGREAREKVEKGLDVAGKEIEKGVKKASSWLKGFFEGEKKDSESEDSESKSSGETI